MTNLESELLQLKRAIIEMLALVLSQLEKSKTAFLTKDRELAQEIIHVENRINAMELSIDRECENILALFQPVATDLRFVISMLKINSDLERIGDYAEGLAAYVIDLKKTIPNEAFTITKMPEMFDITFSMLDDIGTALENEDTSLARKVYHKDSTLNALNSNASVLIRDLIIQDPENTRPLLFLFSGIRKIERVGDHIKNIAEDIIFYIDAEVLKHQQIARKK